MPMVRNKTVTLNDLEIEAIYHVVLNALQRGQASPSDRRWLEDALVKLEPLRRYKGH